MEEHSNYSLSREEAADTNIFCTVIEKEGDSLLIDLVKGYPHLYDKSSKDFKDVIKKNNSWQEIGQILNTTASDCQTRWIRLRERYSREKKSREMETRSGSGRSGRPSFYLYDQMNFLQKFVKSRKSITNLTSKQSKKLTEELDFSNMSQSQIRCNKDNIISKSISNTATVVSSIPFASHSTATEKIFEFSNISQNQIQLDNEDDINRPMLKTVNCATMASTDSMSSAFHSPSHSQSDLALSSYSDNNYHRHIAKESNKLFDNDDDFVSLHSPDALTSDNEASLLKRSETFLKNQKISAATHTRFSSNRKILSDLNQESLESSSDNSTKVPNRLAKKIKRTSSGDKGDKVEESFLKLTSVVSSHLENKPKNDISFNITDEDEIFAKAVACQLKKISEPNKSQLKGQIMKIIYNL